MEKTSLMGFGVGMETVKKGYRKMANAEVKYSIKHIGDHYQGYVDGKFVCSGDRETEVAKDIEEYLYERGVKNV